MNKQAASQKYQQIRDQALQVTLAEFRDILPNLADGIRLTDLTEEALQAQEQIPQPVVPGRQIGWNWREVRDNYRRNHLARIELAIWFNDELCGLMAGKASEGRLVFKLNYMQGGRPQHPLKGQIVPIASRCAELFAIAIAADWIAIQDPMDNDELLEYYRDLGFNKRDPFDPRNNALFKPVEYEG
ncbi:hypothetical protein [Shewanella marisflavi]|uniref:hypothetical protein n=1 Tax=Shewanella marisflavi TaxID=260364 RepID=UPI003AAD6C8B